MQAHFGGTQDVGHLMQRADSLEKTLFLGKIEGKRRREQQRLRWLDGITESMGLSLSKLWEIVEVRQAWHAAVHGFEKSWDTTEQLNNSILCAIPSDSMNPSLTCSPSSLYWEHFPVVFLLFPLSPQGVGNPHMFSWMLQVHTISCTSVH